MLDDLVKMSISLHEGIIIEKSQNMINETSPDKNNFEVKDLKILSQRKL